MGRFTGWAVLGSLAYIQLEIPPRPLKKPTSLHRKVKPTDVWGNPKSRLSPRHVPQNRPSTVEVCICPALPPPEPPVAPPPPPPHPAPVVMQIQSFFKRTRLRKRCQAFGTNQREQAGLPAAGSAPPPVAPPPLQPPSTLARRFPDFF